jgi:hypothetical protein
MRYEQACEILGIPTNADFASAKKAFRTKTRLCHPDTTSGDGDAQIALNQALEVIKNARSGSRSLALQEVATLTETLRTEVAAEHASTHARRDAEDSVRSRMSLLNRIKQAGWVLGLLAALFALYWDKILPKPGPGHANPTLADFRLFAVLFAGAVLVFQAFVQGLDNSVSDYASQLSDNRACAAELANVLGYLDTAVISEDRLSPAHRSRSPFVRLTDYERRKVLVSKAIEHRLLTPRPAAPDALLEYRVAFTPSQYNPDKPVSPTAHSSSGHTVPSRQDPSEQTALPVSCSALMFFSLLALTLYAALLKHSWWAILPGLFCLGAAGAAIGSIKASRSSESEH